MASLALIAIVPTLILIIKGENKYCLIRKFRQQKAQQILIFFRNL